MINLTSYWNDRDSRYRMECTGIIRDNAQKTVDAVNRAISIFEEEMLISRDVCTSGWRPQSVNDATANAGKNSNHLTANAADIGDPDRAFAQWCVNHPDVLAECGLWMEDPRWTPTWVHLQRVPPKSGKRIYIPSNAPPKAPALEGQKPIPTRIVL